MVLLRYDNNPASSHKMGSAMTAAESRRTASDTGRRPENTQYPIKRRSMTTASTAPLPRKRRRTSWGKPHPNLSILRCLTLSIKEEAAASSTSVSDEDNWGGTASSCVMVPSPCQATSFVKTEPLQHLAIKLEDETSDDGPLHQVPTFFSAEHQLLTPPINKLPDEFNQLSRCAHIFPPLSSLAASASPHSSTSPHCSSATDEFSGDDMLSWDQDLHEDSCEFLSERFYEIERDMSSIMGEALHQATKTSKTIPQQQEEFVVTDQCAPQRNAMARILVLKMEEGSECSQFSETSCTASLGTADTATTIEDCEEEYRIDLVDFELEQCDIADEEGGNQKLRAAVAASYQKLRLVLNYEEVMTAWSERGSFYTDGSWGCGSPEGYTLDLGAWEPENQDSRTFHELFPGAGASKMIAIGAIEDGVGAGKDGVEEFSGARHARVLRYREKRQTRLFSKKIRYEVRKLNAERRPRMKGRFIKRGVN